MYRITESVIGFEHNRHVPSCTHQQHIFTTGMTAEEFPYIVHLTKKNNIHIHGSWSLPADQNWRVNSNPYLSSNRHVSIVFLIQRTKFFPSELPFLFHAKIREGKIQGFVRISSVRKICYQPMVFTRWNAGLEASCWLVVSVSWARVEGMLEVIQGDWKKVHILIYYIIFSFQYFPYCLFYKAMCENDFIILI